MRDSHSLRGPIVCKDVDRGEICKLGNQQPRNLVERLIAFEWSSQDADELIEQHAVAGAHMPGFGREFVNGRAPGLPGETRLSHADPPENLENVGDIDSGSAG